ncbi:MAG: hypothetical protein Q8M95_04270 [Candidatus Methanoperedens sp.]|nr:hypothetical protein [Candidatus Methanoperedens sp.]
MKNHRGHRGHREKQQRSVLSVCSAVNIPLFAMRAPAAPGTPPRGFGHSLNPPGRPWCGRLGGSAARPGCYGFKMATAGEEEQGDEVD